MGVAVGSSDGCDVAVGKLIEATDSDDTGVGLMIRSGAVVIAGKGGSVAEAVAVGVSVFSGSDVNVGKAIIVGNAAGGKVFG